MKVKVNGMKKFKALLALVLSVSMVLGSGELPALAETLDNMGPEIEVIDVNIDEAIANGEELPEEILEWLNDVSAGDVSGTEEAVTEEEDLQKVIFDVSEGEETVVTDAVSDVSEGEISDTSVSDNDVSAGESDTDNIFAGMPAGYVLSAEQKQFANELKACMSDIGNMIEGVDYVKGELVLCTDTEEEARMAAQAYGGTLLYYRYTVATIKLPEKVSVMDALDACVKSFSSSNKDDAAVFPVVYPNYYQYIDDVSDDEINSIEEEYEVNSDEELNVISAITNDTNIGKQWQHQFVGDYYAWNKGYEGAGVKVAVIDTGANMSHTDLKGRVVAGYNFVNGANGTNITTDNNGHGTHVCGIIGAAANNSAGGAGIAPKCSVYSYKALDDEGAGKTDDIIAALRAAADAGMDIVNMSLGGPAFVSVYQKACTYAAKKGCTIFAALGNEGTSTKHYPACYSNTTGIAALNQAGGIAYFSNYTSSGTFAFPGVDIYSTTSNGSYGLMSGTSQATPVATGVAAVILSSGKISGKKGTAKVSAVISAMKKGARKVSDKGTGVGYVYIPTALGISTEATAPAAPTFSLSNKNAITNSATVTITAKEYYGTKIYYSTNGKKPVLKNGVVTNGTLYSSAVTISGAKTVTLNAITVNALSGLSSKVTSVKYKINTVPTGVTVTAPMDNSSNSTKAIKLMKGKSATLKAAVAPAYSYNTSVKWTVSPQDKGVKIDSKGKVTVSKTATAGTYTVKAQAVSASSIGAKKADYNGVSGSFSVVVIDPTYKAITIDKDHKKLALVKGQNFVLNTYIKVTLASNGSTIYADKNNAIFKSSNTNIVSVDNAGKLTAVAPGKATITASLNDGSGKKVTCAVTVTQKVNKLNIYDQFNDDSTHKLAPGKTLQMKATVNADATDKKVIWSIAPDKSTYTGVTISSSGKVTAKKNATGTWKVKAVPHDKNSSLTAEFSLAILDGSVTAIKFADKSVNLFTTGSGAKTVTKTPAITYSGTGTAPAPLYSSSNPGIATVDSSTGKVTAVAPGKTVITALVRDGSGKKASYTVNVLIPASKLTIDATGGFSNEYALAANGKVKLRANWEAGNGKISSTKLNWSSSNTNYVKVDKNGQISGVAPGGSATITATAADGSGVKATYTVSTTYRTDKVTVYKYYSGGAWSGFYAKAYYKSGKSYIAKNTGTTYFRMNISGKGSVYQRSEYIMIPSLAYGTNNYKFTFTAADGTNKSGSMSMRIFVY